MRVGFCGPLGGGPIRKEEEGPHHLIAPWEVIDKAEVEVVKSGHGVHQRVSPLAGHSGRRLPKRPRRHASLIPSAL